MSEQGFDNNERIHLWQKRIEEEDEKDIVLTIRYCGQTKGNPWERHRGDMYGTLSTFFSRFLKVLGQSSEDRKTLHDAKIHTVAGAIGQASEDTSNLREQILIALFGDGTLSTEAGGKGVITLFRKDRDHFDSLATHTTRLLMSGTRGTTPSEADGVNAYARVVHRYIGKRTSALGSESFTQSTEAMIVRQGMQSVLINSGSAVMVTLGSDIGESHDSAEDTFWNAGRPSTNAVTRIYNFFSSWESPTALESVDSLATQSLAARVVNNQIPQIDLQVICK